MPRCPMINVKGNELISTQNLLKIWFVLSGQIFCLFDISMEFDYPWISSRGWLMENVYRLRKWAFTGTFAPPIEKMLRHLIKNELPNIDAELEKDQCKGER